MKNKKSFHPFIQANLLKSEIKISLIIHVDWRTSMTALINMKVVAMTTDVAVEKGEKL